MKLPMHVKFHVAKRTPNGTITDEEFVCEGEDLYIPPIGSLVRFDHIPERAAALLNIESNGPKLTPFEIITMNSIAGMKGSVSQLVYVYLTEWQ